MYYFFKIYRQFFLLIRFIIFVQYYMSGIVCIYLYVRVISPAAFDVYLCMVLFERN